MGGGITISIKNPEVLRPTCKQSRVCSPGDQPGQATRPVPEWPVSDEDEVDQEFLAAGDVAPAAAEQAAATEMAATRRPSDVNNNSQLYQAMYNIQWYSIQ